MGDGVVDEGDFRSPGLVETDGAWHLGHFQGHLDAPTLHGHGQGAVAQHGQAGLDGDHAVLHVLHVADGEEAGAAHQTVAQRHGRSHEGAQRVHVGRDISTKEGSHVGRASHHLRHFLALDLRHQRVDLLLFLLHHGSRVVLGVERLAAARALALLVQVVELHVPFVPTTDVRLEQMALRVALATGSAVVRPLTYRQKRGRKHLMVSNGGTELDITGGGIWESGVNGWRGRVEC